METTTTIHTTSATSATNDTSREQIQSQESFTTTMPLSELSQFLSSNPTLQDFTRLFQNAHPTTETDASNLIFQFEIPIPSPEID
jgi:hypothetical protein